ncbi:MAG: hypothetical protein ACYTEQ_05990 [Planctomycetota bacterium]
MRCIAPCDEEATRGEEAIPKLCLRLPPVEILNKDKWAKWRIQKQFVDAWGVYVKRLIECGDQIPPLRSG